MVLYSPLKPALFVNLLLATNIAPVAGHGFRWPVCTTLKPSRVSWFERDFGRTTIGRVIC